MFIRISTSPMLFSFLGTICCVAAMLLPASAAARIPDASLDSTLQPAEQNERFDSSVQFIENVGQFSKSVHFSAWSDSHSLWFVDSGFWIIARQPRDNRGEHPEASAGSRDVAAETTSVSPLQSRPAVALKFSFVGASPESIIEPVGRLQTKISYLLGNDSASWKPNVPVWSGIRYKNLYPGIDLEITGEGGRITQRLIAQPTSDLTSVRLHVEGADTMQLEGNHLYIQAASMQIEVPLIKLVASPELPNSYAPLVPSLHGTEIALPFYANSLELESSAVQAAQGNPAQMIYGTYFGGWGGFSGEYSLAVDQSGDLYLSGYVDRMLDFPVKPGAYDEVPSGFDAFVAKLSPKGNGLDDLIYATFVGGNMHDIATTIAVDANGNAYITGITHSNDFPTTDGAFDELCNSDGTSCSIYTPWNAFLAKLNADGTHLLYGTYMGTPGYFGDALMGIAVDSEGLVYATGNTYSDNFPTTTGALDKTCGTDGTCAHNNTIMSDAVLVVLSLDGNGSKDLRYGTYLGGDWHEQAHDLSIDKAGNLYITGFSNGCPFASFDVNDPADVLVVKLAPRVEATNELHYDMTYGTCIGGDNDDQAVGIDVDTYGNTYVTGYTYSNDFPVTDNAYDTTCNDNRDCTHDSHDSFVAKLSPLGAIVYSTYLGSDYHDKARDIAVDSSGSAYIVGETYSTTFPTTAGAYSTSPSQGGFLAKLNPKGTSLLYSSYIGGYASSIIVEESDIVAIAGGAGPSHFHATDGAFRNWQNNMFLASLDISRGLYALSGLITDDQDAPVADVIVQTNLGSTYTTNASGQFTATSLVAGMYVFTPTLANHMFAPISRTVSVPANRETPLNFIFRPIPAPFLELPISYKDSTFVSTVQGYQDKQLGRVTSWFDHTSPNYTYNEDTTTWLGITIFGAAQTWKSTCERSSCYDGHNGIDFVDLTAEKYIYAASGGVVDSIVRSNSGYGYQIWIDHQNGYATRYGHLLTDSFKITETATVEVGQQIAKMGNTGNSTGTHLHFGVYYDRNGDRQWTEDEAVDPFGWRPAVVRPAIGPYKPDPWQVPEQVGIFLWKHSLDTDNSVGETGGQAASASGRIHISVPPGAVQSLVTLNLLEAPTEAEVSAQLRSTGHTFWLSVLEQPIAGQTRTYARSTTSEFSVPVTVSISYSDTALSHLNLGAVSLYYWDETDSVWMPLVTTVDVSQKQVRAQINETGRFDLQAPLQCAQDISEPDDSFYAASLISVDSEIETQRFDIAEDEDWFKLAASASTVYILNTRELVSGVSTSLSVYARDGIEILASDASTSQSGSYLEWQVPEDGVFFIRVAPQEVSTIGCESTYKLNIEKLEPLAGVSIAGPKQGVISSSYAFTAASSPVTSTAHLSFTWSIEEQEPIVSNGGVTDTVGITWTSAGPKTILVTAANAISTVTGTHVITLYTPVQADFLASPITGTVPLTVTFIDGSSGDIASWEWSFGDADTSSEQNPTHTYLTPGTYTVTLTVNGPGGTNELIKADLITVTEAAVPKHDLYLPTVQNQ